MFETTNYETFFEAEAPQQRCAMNPVMHCQGVMCMGWRWETKPDSNGIERRTDRGYCGSIKNNMQEG